MVPSPTVDELVLVGVAGVVEIVDAVELVEESDVPSGIPSEAPQAATPSDNKVAPMMVRKNMRFGRSRLVVGSFKPR